MFSFNPSRAHKDRPEVLNDEQHSDILKKASRAARLLPYVQVPPQSLPSTVPAQPPIEDTPPESDAGQAGGHDPYDKTMVTMLFLCCRMIRFSFQNIPNITMTREMVLMTCFFAADPIQLFEKFGAWTHAEDRAKYSVSRLKLMMAESDKRLDDILGVLDDLETHWLAPAKAKANDDGVKGIV